MALASRREKHLARTLRIGCSCVIWGHPNVSTVSEFWQGLRSVWRSIHCDIDALGMENRWQSAGHVRYDWCGIEGATVTVLPMTVQPLDDAKDSELQLQVMLTRGESVKGKAKEGMIGNYFERKVRLKVYE